MLFIPTQWRRNTSIDMIETMMSPHPMYCNNDVPYTVNLKKLYLCIILRVSVVIWRVWCWLYFIWRCTCTSIDQRPLTTACLSSVIIVVLYVKFYFHGDLKFHFETAPPFSVNPRDFFCVIMSSDSNFCR